MAIPKIRHCEKCNVDVLNWSYHLKTKKHLENDPDQTIKPNKIGRPRPSDKRLRWSRGSVLAFGTQVRRFKPGRSHRIFRAKKSSTRLPSEGK
jgi:hypothetical protein